MKERRNTVIWKGPEVVTKWPTGSLNSMRLATATVSSSCALIIP